MTDRFEYKFRIQGGTGPGLHCTHCPLPVGDSCSLKCAEQYTKLQREREADGIKINDTP